MAGGHLRSNRSAVLLALGLTVNLAPIATFAAVLPEVSAAWGLSSSQAGWIGGIYFGGYAAAVPVLATMTDRVDGRWIFAGSSLLAAAASLVFAGSADGFWSAFVLRLLNGVALAGVHMPGLKLLAERTQGRGRARGAAVYSACYSLGAAASFFLAGAVDAGHGWRAAFAVSGLVPLVAIGIVASLSAATETVANVGFTYDVRPLLRNRALMAYVVAFAGNIWEVSAVRAWFVAYLAWTFSLPHHRLDVPSPPVISGLASLAGFPVSIIVAECALRWGPRAIVVTCLASVAILVALAGTAGGPSVVVLPLLVLAQIAALADASALAAGAVAAADPARRGAALAMFASVGYTAAFIGPVAAGLALDAFGGGTSPTGWSVAFATMALGSSAAAWAVGKGRRIGGP
ncbi:MAG TPA: MFS transporter [Stellaceae bacterium]|nr:MFS transporter [Stellaceae bacterium]